jgi:hypothetical protein
MHRVRPAGVDAAGDDAEVGARLLERVRLDVGLGGGLLDGLVLRLTVHRLNGISDRRTCALEKGVDFSAIRTAASCLS